MSNAQNLNFVSRLVDCVEDDVGQPWNRKFANAFNLARTGTHWKMPEPINGSFDRSNHALRSNRIALGDIAMN